MSLFDSASLVVTPNGVKAGKLYSIKPTDGSGDLSVVRATTATRVNSDGLIESVGANIPRLDYSNGSCPSILVEPQRTNLFIYSEQFNNLIKERTTVISDAIIAPNGTLTADKLVEDSSLNSHRIRQNISIIDGKTYTFTIYAKASERNKIRLFIGGENKSCDFDLINGTLLNNSGLYASITPAEYGFFRCSITITATLTGSKLFLIAILDDNYNFSYQGDGTSGIYIWGAQLEAGSNATSYIPTVASTVTRNADVITKTGISSLINSEEGCFFVDFLDINISDNQFKEFSLSDGTINNIIRLGYVTNAGANLAISCNVILSNVTQFTFSQSFIKGVRNKILLRYKQGEFSLFRNGVLLTQQNSGNIFDSNILSQFHYSRNNQTAFFVGNVNSNLLLPYLTNQQCIDLTTL